MSDIHVVVLAAGKGTRMKSSRPKVLHHVGGVPMIQYVLDTANQLSPRSIAIVVGHQADVLRAALAHHSDLEVVVQEPQLGTGDALRTAERALEGATGTLILLSGDVPLLTPNSLKMLVDRHRATEAVVTVMTAMVEDPKGYGRIVRSGSGAIGPPGGPIARIVEDKDASAGEREIREINSGIYAFELAGLFDAVRGLGTDNAQKEYYLPDLVAVFRQRRLTVETVTVANPDEIQNINSRIELAAVSRIMRQAKNAELMAAGVTIEDPATTYIDRDVTVGVDTIIHPGVWLEGTTTVGESCEIHSGVRIVSSQIGNRVTVLNHCVINESLVADGASIGPFTHLRNQATIGPRAKVGNFVEVKKTSLGAGSKAMHLTYLGDAVIGEHVNIGAGTITCNYDGKRKQTTTIEDGAFIGSDTQLIAPITVGTNAYVGTGTTLRQDVPPGALSVSAGKQRNIQGWVEKKGRSKKSEVKT